MNTKNYKYMSYVGFGGEFITYRNLHNSNWVYRSYITSKTVKLVNEQGKKKTMNFEYDIIRTENKYYKSFIILY